MATVNLALLFALTAFSGSAIAGPMMVLIMSATGMPSWVGNCLWASSRPSLISSRAWLGVAKLCRGHEFAEARCVSLLRRLRGGEQH
jgi:hypothetical protein